MMASETRERILSDTSNYEDFVIKTMSGTEIERAETLFKDDQAQSKLGDKSSSFLQVSSSITSSLGLEPTTEPAVSVKCVPCNQSFSTLKELRQHRPCPNGKKKLKYVKAFVCEHCHEAYTTRYRLDKHLDEHENYKYKCTDCHITFKVKRQLVAHQKESHCTRKKTNRRSHQTLTLQMTCETESSLCLKME